MSVYFVKYLYEGKHRGNTHPHSLFDIDNRTPCMKVLSGSEQVAEDSMESIEIPQRNRMRPNSCTTGTR